MRSIKWSSSRTMWSMGILSRGGRSQENSCLRQHARMSFNVLLMLSIPIKIFRFSHVISANKEYEIVSKPWALLPICARRSIIGGGGADIHLFMFTDHNNNWFRKKWIMQKNEYINMTPPPPPSLPIIDPCTGCTLMLLPMWLDQFWTHPCFQW